MAERSRKTTPAWNPNPGAQRVKNNQDGRTAHELTEESSPPTGHVVVFSLGWVVTGAETGQDAINIAVSEVGKRIGSTGEQIRSVDISVQRLGCHSCGSGSDALLLVSETALVGLFLEVEVATEDPETAETISRREVGPNLHNTPLDPVDIVPID